MCEQWKSHHIHSEPQELAKKLKVEIVMHDWERKLITFAMSHSSFGEDLQVSQELFRREFHPELSSKEDLIESLLSESYTERNCDDVAYSLFVGFAFGFSGKHAEILCKLLDCDWHKSHENIVIALDELLAPFSIPYLHRVTFAEHDYLAYDHDTRTLAYRAIWALSKISMTANGKAALKSLEDIARAAEPIVSEMALERIDEMKGNGTI